MSTPRSTADAVRAATEVRDPQRLADLYESNKDNIPVVNALVQNQACPDEVKKKVLSYILGDRLPRYVQQIPSGQEMLSAMVKSLEAWQPIQRTVSLPSTAAHDEELKEILDIASKRGAVVITGVPGTSKTFYARVLASILSEGDPERVEFCQFHASYAYEDFIEGIVPRLQGTMITYGVEDKVFKRFCVKAQKNPSKRFAFVIDEINRADLSRVFGELMTSLEYRGLPVSLVYSRDPLIIPSNVVVIGTMNTLDRSTFELDYALRRRFYFFELKPSVDRLVQVITENGTKKIEDGFLGKLKVAFASLQAFYPLGHAYFKDISTPEDLRRLWQYQLKPLVAQYLEFEPAKVKSIEDLLVPLWSQGA